MRGSLLFVLSVVFCSGCSIVRAEVGYGIGLGTHVKFPGLIHAGLSAGEFRNIGWHNYGGDSDATLHSEAEFDLVLWHWHGLRKTETPYGHIVSDGLGLFEGRLKCHHACFALFPPLTSYAGGRDGDRDAWAFEIGAKLLFFDFVLGINPAAGF